MLKIRVDAGSALGTALKFTNNNFSGWIEIYEDQKTDREIIYLQYINSKLPRQGNVKELIKYWIDLGFRVRIVRPIKEMQNIIIPLGFCYQEEMKPGMVPIGVPVEIWRLLSDVD